MKFNNIALSVLSSITFLSVSLSIYLAQHYHPPVTISQSTLGKFEPIEKIKEGLLSIPKNMTQRQAELLVMAYNIAKRDGHSHPRLLQGIILQESKAGEDDNYKVGGIEYGLKANKRYYGVSQLKLGAARDVLSRYPQMKKQFDIQTTADEEIIAKLIEDDHFNLAVASKYLLILKSYGYKTVKQLALAYNQGPAGAKLKNADTHHYALGVVKYIQLLTPEKRFSSVV